MFTEGWVEFKDKKIAKAVARSLNGQIVGERICSIPTKHSYCKL